MDRVEKQINENNEILINSMNEYNNEIEYKINKCNTETEDVYKRQVIDIRVIWV